MSRWMVGLGIGWVIGLAGGCGRSPAPPRVEAGGETPALESRGVTLAAIPKSTGGDFWETVEVGARRAAEERGVELKWEGTVTETEIAEQNKIMENMINLGVDGIALAPLNKKAQMKLVQQAVGAGIPVVIFDSAVEGAAHSSFVATDNKAGGALGGEHLASLLGGSGKAMIMRYVQGTGSTEARVEGAMEALASAGIEVVADPYPDTGTIEGCKSAAANTLEGFVQDGKLALGGIFAANLYSTLGVASALDDLRKSGIEVTTRFVGFDTSTKLITELQAGRIDALVSQNPDRMGYLAVDTIARIVDGESVAERVDTGVELVTKERLDTDAALRTLVGL